MTPQALVSHTVDTARWVAAHRAVESARPDALFRDPLAKRLVGARGRVIDEAADQEIADDWFLITRTKLIDDHIATAVAAGCELVINLGAGLDTRPYRMKLPADVRWIEADVPGLVADKDALLADEAARCELTRTGLDLTDSVTVTGFFDTALADARKALVVTEGLDRYFDKSKIIDLSRALRRSEVVEWCLDFNAVGVAQIVADRRLALLAHAPLACLPIDGVACFENHGWSVAGLEPIVTAADRFDRLPPLIRLAPGGSRSGVSPYRAVIRLI
ncbi:class I SAM-dependent methyltransferase [Nocardia sp. NPDC059180]|uniref:class I SAM-dependent methyltransferase n=1 Tax=Nocardia sp. NPDC059180 TaxID=3346761 RepID=UPI00369104CF